MSIESLEAGSFVVNPPHQETYATMAEEAKSAHFDEVDQRIVNSLDGAQDEIVISYRTIAAQTRILENEVAREEARIVDQAQLERIEARQKRDRLMDEIERAYQEQLQEINQDESESLGEIRQTGKDGKEFFAACKRVGDTISEAINQYRAQHDELIQTVDQVHFTLMETQTEIMTMEARRHEKTQRREELLRDHEATGLITDRNRQKRVELMRLSVDKNDDFQRQRQSLENQPAPQSVADINMVLGEFEQQEFAFHRTHSDILARVAVLDDEIETAVLENRQRDEIITQLRYDIDALSAECEGLREYIGTLEEYLTRLDAMKLELEQTTAALQDRAEAIQIIGRDGFEAIDSIPIELQEIVKAAVGMKSNRGYEQASVDYTTAIPEIGRSIFKIDVSPEHLPVDALTSVIRADSHESNPTSAQENLDLTLDESVEKLTGDVTALREWVQNNALQLLPDAAKVIPQKITTPGMRAQLRVAGR